MSLEAALQVASSVSNVLSPLVFGVGYYLMIRLYREWVHQTQVTHEAGGRPLVVVAADYSHLPRVNLVVLNFNKAPAKDVEFDFSAPVENSSGFILSDLPYLKEGLPSSNRRARSAVTGIPCPTSRRR